MTKRAVFIDRDGTVNEDVGHLGDTDRLRLLPGVGEALLRLHDAGFLLFVVSNQSGVGRGYFDSDAVRRVNLALERALAAHGVKFERIYVCPHRPDEECDCRKPRTGLITRSAEEFALDLGRSYMVGDKLSDVEAGRSAGCKSVLVTTGRDPAEYERLRDSATKPDSVAADLGEAVDWIISDSRGG